MCVCVFLKTVSALAAAAAAAPGDDDDLNRDA